MATAVVSGRVSEVVKQQADAAMRKAGLTPTDVIQNLWSAMARTGDVPDVAKPASAQVEGHAAGITRLERFLESLPPVNPEYARLTDDEILAFKVHDYV